jgi:hypothetical protein
MSELKDPRDKGAMFARPVTWGDQPDHLEFRWVLRPNVLSPLALREWIEFLEAGWRPVVNSFKHPTSKSSGFQGTAILMARMKDGVQPARTVRDNVYQLPVEAYGDLYHVNVKDFA